MNCCSVAQKLCKYATLLRYSSQSFSLYPKHNLACRVTKLFLRSTIPVLSSARSFWEAFPHSGRYYFHQKDRLPFSYELISHTKYFYYAFYGQLFSLVAFAAQIVGGLYNIYVSQIPEAVTMASNFGLYSSNNSISTLGVVCIFTLQNFLLYVASQNAVLRVYYKEDTDEYIIISLASNPFKSRLTYCKPGEFEDLDLGFLQFVLGTHFAHGRRFYVSFFNFKSMFHYNRLVQGI